MKFPTVAAAVSAAMMAGVAHAEDVEEAPVVPDLPKFTVSSVMSIATFQGANCSEWLWHSECDRLVCEAERC